MEQERALKESWDINADAWTDAVRANRIESRLQVTNAAIVQAVLRQGGQRVLDVGCGEGWLARELARADRTVTGVDGSAELVARARELGGADYRTLTYTEIAGRPEALAGPYDCAVCNFSLLGEDLRGLLNGIRQALAQEGCLLIQTLHPYAVAGAEPYRNGWRVESFAGMGDGFTAPMPWYFRTVAAWFAELSAAGFQVTGLEEPVHPRTGRPLSLLLTGVPTP